MPGKKHHKHADDCFEIARGYFEKGYALQQRGHLDRAAHCYKRSIEFLPTARAYTFLGWVYSLKNLYTEAIDACKKAIELDADYGNPYNDIGAYLIQLKRFDEAIPWLLKAIDAPDYENYCYPFVNLGRIYEWKGDWNRAKYYYQRALDENPDSRMAARALECLLAKYN